MESTATTIVNISIILGLISVLIQIATIIWFLYLYNRKTEVLQKEAALQAMEGEKKILEERINAQESSFISIGKEIHDNVTQLVSLIKMNLAVLEIAPTEKNKLHYKELNELTLVTLKSLSGISKSLNPKIVLEFGLNRMTQEEIERISIACDTTVSCEANFELDKIYYEYQLDVFRIFQEAIRNAIQHGNARNITIKCNKENSSTFIDICDDGKGFDTSIKKPGTISQGIENMKSRCLNASGIFAIQSDIEEGTKIHLEFPNDELFKRTLESIQPNSDSFNEFEIDINKHEIT
ncbi:MAG: hypothetical protein LCH51_11245 [Bacteroidetes bacterium]|nr:hypothetical protein [Bacteroidota bacterium]